MARPRRFTRGGVLAVAILTVYPISGAILVYNGLQKRNVLDAVGGVIMILLSAGFWVITAKALRHRVLHKGNDEST
jgi:hypothetical protein